MNLYSCTPFLKAFNKAYFPQIQLYLQDFCLQEKVWRLPTFPDGKPMTQWQFIDFFEPLPFSKVKSINRKVFYIPRVSHGLVTKQEWFEKKLFVPYEASPLIDWHRFSTWENFLEYIKSNRSRLYRDSQRRLRKLEQDLGDVTFSWQDTRPEALYFCTKWKAIQFHEAHKLFADAKNISFFHELVNANLLVVSSLSVGDKFLAVDLGAVWNNRFYLWITAYDPQYSNYSPGRLLMHWILENSYRKGHEEFDFLLGGEKYKWYYATHSRMISDIGGLTSYFKTFLKKKISYAPIYKMHKIKHSLQEKYRHTI